jgi:aspartyl-tRNA(Asn)/glutamyl-tRNA(Gln) amidotransferase subunit C
MPHLTPSRIDAVAALAHLRLQPGQRERLAADLERILDYVDQLRDVNTENVPETAHVADVARPWRDDVVAPSLGVDEALANAPDADRATGTFRVPRVVGG